MEIFANLKLTNESFIRSPSGGVRGVAFFVVDVVFAAS